jgi:predicted small integral membrane protein
MTRTSIALTALVGLVGAVVITGFCIYLVTQPWYPTIITNSSVILVLFLFLAVFSVAEIPLMIYGLRSIAASANPRAGIIVLITTAGYTLFAAVYATPLILLTENLWAGVALAGLSLVRFISAVTFLPPKTLGS